MTTQSAISAQSFGTSTNIGNGKFSITALPLAAQVSTLNGMQVDDFNGDGKKDIAFLDGAAGNIHLNDPLNIMIKKRSVFIRTGNQFIEQDFYQFDPYMKSLLVNVK